jgi:NADH:ubiquinone oxidoreductase subunit 5 (subunit L)/multisubunit Na+/H+ antiporter MnhA subunit
MEAYLYWTGLTLVASPLLLISGLVAQQVFGLKLGEKVLFRWTLTLTSIGLLACVLHAIGMLYGSRESYHLELGQWVALDELEIHFHFKFLFDRLSLPFCLFSWVLCWTVVVFSHRYLHRENGYERFFFGYGLFVLGITLASLAGTVEVLFCGWEMVGLSSALLIAFFQERSTPVRHGLRVWSIYRFADAAFLVAVLLLHHLSGEGDFEHMTGDSPWPITHSVMAPETAFWVGLLLLVAAAGKSGLIPFSGWLPRAMEGPTPSSAIFYGALSVHLGAFLLLRSHAILLASPALCMATVGLGLATALLAGCIARVQPDIKSSLAFASLTQVGLIVAEIGLGLEVFALIHIIGHGCLRTLQLLRAPTLLHDYHTIENAIGHRPVTQSQKSFGSMIPKGLSDYLYALAHDKGGLDRFLNFFFVNPCMGFFRWCDRNEKRITTSLSVWVPSQPDRSSRSAKLIEPMEIES